MPKQETVEIQKELFQEGGKLGKYQELILGEKSLIKLFKFEMIIGLTSWVPGALGLLLRSRLYPKLIGRVGRNVTFGAGVVLRHPKKIFIGDNVVIDDHCVLDAKGADNRGIFIGDGVFLGRNTILNCKNGDIILEDNVNIGFNCMIFSASHVRVGADQLMAAYCYLVGGTHAFNNPAVPVLHQPRSSQGITIGPGGWLGAHVSVFDGVTIGKHAVIGAGSTVNKDVPDYAIAAGVPVRLIKERKAPKEKARRKKAITVGLINFNGATVLAETIRSVLYQDYPNIKDIILVDNSSIDQSVRLVKKNFPSVKIHVLENRGPNPARNLILQQAKSDLVLLMDSDVVLSSDVLTKLECALYQNPHAGIASAQIRFAERPEEIQYNGADIHYAGGAVMNPYDLEKPVAVGAVPAGTILVDRKRAKMIGNFDEDFFYGWADGDFTYRMTLAGYPCLNVSKAHVFHKKEKKGMSWVKYQVRNRWWFVLKTYNWRTLLAVLPAIVLYQFAIFGFMVLKGQAVECIKGNLLVWTSLPSILQKRKVFMKIKKVKDKQVLTGKHIDLLGGSGGSVVLKAGNAACNLFFSIYWMLAKWLIK